MDTNFITSEVFAFEICPKLCIKDIYNLSLVSKICKHYFSKIIVDKIINNINIRLRKYFRKKHYNNVIDIIKKTNCVISGSLIIQCILEEYWDSDIDIYSSSSDNLVDVGSIDSISILEKYFYDNYEWMNKFKWENYHHTMGDDDKLKIRLIQNYMIPYTNIHVQSIKIDVVNDICNIKEFIYKTFDFDICKNMYYFKDNQPQLSIYNINQILNKQTEFKYAYRSDSSIGRMIKYSNRGFKFDTSKITFEELASKSFNDICNRYLQINIVFKLKKSFTDTNSYFYELTYGELNEFKKSKEFCESHSNSNNIKKKNIELTNDNKIIINKKIILCTKPECFVRLFKSCDNKEYTHFHIKGVHLGNYYSNYILVFV